MPTFTVTKKETTASSAEFEARDEKHALQLAKALDGTDKDVPYSNEVRKSVQFSVQTDKTTEA